MDKIEPVYLHNMRNGEHLQFMSSADKLIATYLSELPALDGLYPAFKLALDTESATIQTMRGSIKSETITGLNTLRVQTWSALIARIKSAMLSPLADEAESGWQLKCTIGQHSNLRIHTIDSRSSIISGFIREMQKPELALHARKINITTLVEELKNQNEQFLDLMMERTSELADRNSGDVRAVRSLIDPAYVQIVGRINAAIVLGLARPETEAFVAKLNEHIRYYKLALATRRGRSRKRREMKERVSEEGKG
ncbi:MAG: DUF6261 family protein [Bacteroidota bacterium]|nr:DUF6261 family protein [Bacteroidota bacterium]